MTAAPRFAALSPDGISSMGALSVRPLPGGEGGHLPRDPCPMQERNRNVPIHLKMTIVTLHLSTDSTSTTTVDNLIQFNS